jgi:hypothetical protein
VAGVPLPVHLTAAQVAWANRVGDLREDANSHRAGRHGAARYDPTASRQLHRDGAQCEAAVLVAQTPELRRQGLVPWRCWQAFDPAADPRTIRGDVDGWEVRSTRRRSGCLIVQADDDPGARFVLVVNQCPDFLIMGWLYGRDAKRPQWWRRPPAVPSAAYFVPPAALHPPPASWGWTPPAVSA